jgi:SAM-dependent methyltransferase
LFENVDLHEGPALRADGLNFIDMAESVYIHGTEPEEQQRLSLLNKLLNDVALQRLAVREGEKILDVGSGLGQFTCAMARAAGNSGEVVGIERSIEQLQQAQKLSAVDNESIKVDFRQGDATDPPLRADEWSTFDIVHSRFLLEHLQDPIAAVRTMIRAARPGGRIILQDDDHDVLRIFPEPDGFYALWEAYIRSFEKLGNDPYIGRRLVSLLHQCGAEPTRNDWLFFGSCSGHPHFRAFATNLRGVIQTAKQTILSYQLMKEQDFDTAIKGIQQWEERSDAAIWYAVCWAEARKR